MDENSLIRSAKSGDLDAFNILVLNYQDLVYNQAYRMLGERDAAEDATQVTFISAYKNLAGFRNGSFKAWLLRIVSNACYDKLRRWQAHPSVPSQPADGYGEENEYPYWLTDSNPIPEEYLEHRELETTIQLCFEKIAPEYRVALVLVDMQGMSYAEAAEAMGKPIGTIKSRLARGRMLLRAHLQVHWNQLPFKLMAATSEL